MKILNLLDKNGEITEIGHAVLESDKSEKEILKDLITDSKIGQVWMRHTGVTSIDNIPPETVTTMLENRSNLAVSTAKRRGRTLKRWLNFFKIGQ